MVVETYLYQRNRVSDIPFLERTCSINYSKQVGSLLSAEALIQGISNQDQSLCQDRCLQESEFPLISPASSPELPFLPDNRGCTCIYLRSGSIADFTNST